MTNETRLRNAKFLNTYELAQLVGDLFMEFDPGLEYDERRTYMPRFGQILWYIRNYTYSPLSLIGDITGVTGPVKRLSYLTHECIDNFERACHEKPVSLDATNYDALQIMKAVGDYYGLAKNVALETVNDETSDALLYMQHLATKSSDKKKVSGGGTRNYKATPTDQPLYVTLLDLQMRLDKGRSIFEIHDDYVINSIYNT